MIHQKFAEKTDLASLILDIGKLDIGKLQATSVDLSKLSNVIKNDVVKKTFHDELVKKLMLIWQIKSRNGNTWY